MKKRLPSRINCRGNRPPRDAAHNAVGAVAPGGLVELHGFQGGNAENAVDDQARAGQDIQRILQDADIDARAAPPHQGIAPGSAGGREQAAVEVNPGNTKMRKWSKPLICKDSCPFYSRNRSVNLVKMETVYLIIFEWTGSWKVNCTSMVQSWLMMIFLTSLLSVARSISGNCRKS